MGDSDFALTGCFGIFSARKTRKKRVSCCSCQQHKPPTAINISAEKLSLRGKNDVAKDVFQFGSCCDFSYKQSDAWRIGHENLPSYSIEPCTSNSKDAATIIECTIDSLNSSLRDLSLKIHDHPELMFKESYAHDLLTEFMANHGFKTKRHYLGLDTAWRAEYSQGKGGRVIGINSEMDALPGMGHGCGHNLIAVSGVGVAIALKSALEARPHIAGKVILLGTPAEEGGGGKIILLERGAYDEMDACIMCHPTPGPPRSISTGTSNAMQQINVEYLGHSSHAGAAPWEGTNALDAAFLAYSNISALRQQIKPDHRIHGIVEGKNWQPNVIPDYAKMSWLVRAPTSAELTVFTERVQNCLLAAALATGCRVDLKREAPYFDLHQNPVLAQNLVDIVGNRYGVVANSDSTTASTDFGNVSYVLPALHPAYAIPTEPNGGNHTPGFARASRTDAAHAATIIITKGLALLGYRALTDDIFFKEVREAFEEWKFARR